MKAAAVTPLAFDLQDALAPISADEPAGESLRYDALFDEIKELRREDDSTLPQGVWKRDFKKADWSRVATLALEGLQTRTKDLQVAAWLVEAWTHLHGFSGTELGLRLVTGLCQDFWDDVHPQLEAEGPEFRLAPLEWLATHCVVAIKTIPVSSPETDDALAYTWADWERALHLAQQVEADQVSEEQAESEGKLTKAKFLASVSLTASAFFMRLADEVRRSLAAVDELAALLAEKLPETAPSFSELRTTLEAIERFVVRNLQERMEDVEAPGDGREGEVAAAAGLDEEAEMVPAGGPIASRADAYRRLNQAAEYLLRTEPHSPAPYLVKRAVSWGGLTLAELLQELLEQNTDLVSIYKLLGIRHMDKR